MSARQRRRLVRELRQSAADTRIRIDHRPVRFPHLERKGVRDIFTVKIPMSKRCVILGSGPLGIPHYPKLNSIGDIIACNQAAGVYLDYPYLNKPLWWIIEDDRAVYRHYFDRIDQAYDGYRAFSKFVISTNKMQNYGDKSPEKCFTFDMVARNHYQRKFIPTYDFFIINCTVAGGALWLAYIMGCREMVLCGVDMSGDYYFDGQKSPDKVHGATWNVVSKLDNQIEWMQDQGVTVSTISETKLKIPPRI